MYNLIINKLNKEEVSKIEDRTILVESDILKLLLEIDINEAIKIRIAKYVPETLGTELDKSIGKLEFKDKIFKRLK